SLAVHLGPDGRGDLQPEQLPGPTSDRGRSTGSGDERLFPDLRIDAAGRAADGVDRGPVRHSTRGRRRRRHLVSIGRDPGIQITRTASYVVDCAGAATVPAISCSLTRLPISAT